MNMISNVFNKLKQSFSETNAPLPYDKSGLKISNRSLWSSTPKQVGENLKPKLKDFNEIKIAFMPKNDEL